MNVEELKKYKDNLYSALSRDLAEFEKNFILISTGILAFTITFIKDLIKIDETELIFLLIMSWILIIISIGLMMSTFIMSAKASDDLFKEVDDFIIQNSLFDNSTVLQNQQAMDIKTRVNQTFYNSKYKLRQLRMSAVICFILGIGVLSFFVYFNLAKQTKKSIIKTNQTTIIIKDSINTNSTNFKVTYEKFKQTDSATKANN
jgi:hypothetical protein